MRFEPGKFGTITIDGRTWEHDVVVSGGRITRRDKKPSKRYRARFGHTPLSVDEAIPWGGRILVIGTGYDGRLPVMDEVFAEAGRRGIRVVAEPTPAACARLAALGDREIRAILHTTC